MSIWRRATSLRFRLLAVTLVALALALLLAGVLLSGLFRDHVMRQFEATLTQQLDQLTARLELDATGQPLIDPRSLSDPRWQKPYSGLYWQLDRLSADGSSRADVLRSRSLWDTSLSLLVDELADGAVHVHRGRGPLDVPLLLLERKVRIAEQPDARWRIVVAADMREITGAVDSFNGVMAASLAVLLVLLVLAALAQVAVGLSPLHAMQRALADLHEGRTQRLQGRFPTEVQPLIDDFNDVLDRNAEVVARARTQAGNLAHALKTPLSVLDQAAASTLAAQGGELARLVKEQVELSRRHIDWHLARARVAATQRLPGQRTALGPVLAGLVRVMERVYAERGISITVQAAGAPLFFAGEEQDLQEMLGNLLDNACKWARSTVTVAVEAVAGVLPPELQVHVEDDGPGIGAGALASVGARGVRLDESVPGTGLGLAIVQDLVGLYGGQLSLQPAAGGGLRASLRLPAALAPEAAAGVKV
ncbi:MAG: sensor histidine kinase [Polaromonas sp.]|uniref:sensor histidine kinase n=1 Tax=Polaromonas sp. TaxID=1869339 RepID=UPI0040361804